MASSNKRERDLARARYEARQKRRREQHAAQRRRQQLIGGIVALVVVLGGIGWFVAANRSDEGTTAGTNPDVVVTPGASASPGASDTPSASPSQSSSAKGCTEPAEPTTKTQTWDEPPADTVVIGETYRITLKTNCGDVVIESGDEQVKNATETVNSQLFLAQQGFFDASDCFRLTTANIFVLQCGSPNNDGTGGPGYTVPDENLPAEGANNYPAGTVAMANSGADTNGSQFFLVYEDTTLGPNYTIWGTVVSGLDVLKKVAEQGVQGGGTDGAPVQPLVITKATTSQR